MSFGATFNRTSVELKLSPNWQYTETLSSFNRTSVELKLISPSCAKIALKAFNRTSVELKLGLYYPSFKFKQIF